MSDIEDVDNSMDSRFFQSSRFLINKANNRFFIELHAGEKNEDFDSMNADEIDRLRKPQPDKIDVLIITAASGEQEALYECTDSSEESLEKAKSSWQRRRSYPNLEYHQRQFTCSGERKITVAAVNALDHGEIQAALAASDFASLLKPRCLAIVGICAGYRKEVSIGDVIVAEKLFRVIPGKLPQDSTTYKLKSDWYRQIKNYENKSNQIDWTKLNVERPKSYEYQSHWLLHTLFDCQVASLGSPPPENHPDRDRECPDFEEVVKYLEKDGLLEWNSETSLVLTCLGLNKIKKERILRTKVNEPEFPRIWFRPVATGPDLLEEDDPFENIRRQQNQRYTCGYDMEGYSVAESAWYKDLERMIFVKAVSDYGDSQRRRNGHFRHYSCKAAAIFLIHFLKEHYLG